MLFTIQKITSRSHHRVSVIQLPLDLLSSLERNSLTNVPFKTDKYYVVDTGYPNRKGFLSPYRGVRYHIPEFQANHPRGQEEKFNSLHSSLRNVIERSFGVLKKHWNILNIMLPYQYLTQVKIVIVAMALHNFIIEEGLNDVFYKILRMKIAVSTNMEPTLKKKKQMYLMTMK